MSTLSENSGAYGWNTIRGMSWQRVGAASWDSSVFWLTLVVSLGAVGARIGPWLQQCYDGQPIVQGKLAAQHSHALAYTKFTPVQCLQHWDIMRGTCTVVAELPTLLGVPCRRRLSIVCIGYVYTIPGLPKYAVSVFFSNYYLYQKKHYFISEKLLEPILLKIQQSNVWFW